MRMFVRPDLSGSAMAVGAYTLPDDTRICDLDDAATLMRLALRPSHVVTRQLDVTQGWALRIFEEQRWIGVRWWSYYDARWYSFAIWDRTGISVERVEPLTLDHPAVIEASDVLRRPRVAPRKR